MYTSSTTAADIMQDDLMNEQQNAIQSDVEYHSTMKRHRPELVIKLTKKKVVSLASIVDWDFD